ncbi:extracellular solute-binding protein [Salinisphaera sp. LB1]|uniref:extracellular solute-binding protein n=1 Tax=Salinisphaera sp. LB1 TaxID=2183911 RepID=UPI000D705CB9
MYGIPRGANTLVLYYNADMFKAHGLNPNKPPKTWKALYQDARKLTDPKKNVYGLTFCAKANGEGTFQFLPWVQMTGGNWNRIDTPGAARALNLWKKFIDQKIASPDTLVHSQWESTATFVAGNAAMAISGPWELPRMQKNAHFDFRAAMLPIPAKNGQHASALGGGDNVILANTKHPEAAFKFLEFAYKQMPTVWNRFGYLPASRVAVKNPKWPKSFRVFKKSMKYARVRGPSPEWSRISQAIYSAVQQTLTHQKSAKAALAAAQKRIDSVTGK